MPTIDIALPFYGDVEMMKAAVSSVLNQTDKDFRLVVGDDGHPDPSVSKWFSKVNDSRVVYFRNQENLGANGNFRKCLDYVTADYVVIMGADDIMHSNYISTLRQQIAQHPEASMFQPKVNLIDEHGAVIMPMADRIKNKLRLPQGIYSGEQIVKTLMTGNWLYFPSILWKTSEINQVGFRDGLNVAQDLAMAIDLFKLNKSMCVFDDVVFDYRRHSSGDSAVKALSGDRFIEERKFFNDLATEFDELKWPVAARAARFHLTSRLNAASLLVLAIKKRKGAGTLLAHVVR